MSSPVLAPLPRRATGGNHMSTQPGTEPGWGMAELTMEATVRAVPELMQTTQNPMPTSERTEAAVPTVPEMEGGFGFFKALTITLFLAALAIAAYYYYSLYGGPSPDEPYTRPINAPVPGETKANPDINTPLYEQDIPDQNRDVNESRKAEADGDRMFQSGSLNQAASDYKKAFRFNPRPEVALKLGEVYWQRYHVDGQRPQIDEARAWWSRHLTDLPDSKARAYIEQSLQSLAVLPGQ
jgi:serine/threonine-protein kinase